MLRRACRWQLLPALILGAITTILVAWSTLFWPEVISKQQSPTKMFVARGPTVTPEGLDGVTDLYSWSTPGCTQYTSTSISVRYDSLVFMRPRPITVSQFAPPRILKLLSIQTNDPFDYREVFAHGWPMRSLASSYSLSVRNTGGSQPQIRYGIQAPGHWVKWPFSKQFPTLPLFPGFAADTALFAAGCWLLLSIPALRRRHRKLAHQCPHCAYDRRGLPANSPCPECGRPT